MSSTVASRPSYAGSVISGFTSTSAVNSSPSSPCLVTSISGWASGSRELLCSASRYFCGSRSLIAWSRTASRPTCRSMTAGGTLPRRKPGTLICLAICWYAASRLGLSSSKGTSTVSLARVGLKVSTALFTASPSGGPACTALSVGATGLEPAVSCSQSRRASHYATPRQTGSSAAVRRPWTRLGADDGNRTRVASLEDWGSTIELHPRVLGTRARRPRKSTRLERSAPRNDDHGAVVVARPRASTSRRAAPSKLPRSRCSASPSIRSMPRSMSRRGSSTMPSV